MADKIKNSSPRFWRSKAELENDPQLKEKFNLEFSEGASEAPAKLEDGISRRRFLSLLGATTALAATGCTRNADRGSIVPYTNRPEYMVLGKANYYASAMQEGLTTYSVLVKTRESRPVLIEGNKEHAVSQGAVGPRTMAEIMALYDPDRLQKPTRASSEITWDQAIDSLHSNLLNGETLLVSEAVISPSRKLLLDKLSAKFPGLKHVCWEPGVSFTALEASTQMGLSGSLPVWTLDKADVVVCLEADIFSTDGNQLTNIRDFNTRRQLHSAREAGQAGAMSRVYAVEGRFSLLGGKSDHRIPLKPSAMAAFAFSVAAELNKKYHMSYPAGIDVSQLKSFNLSSFVKEHGLDEKLINVLVGDLAVSRSHSLIIAGGSLPTEAQFASNMLNYMLGSVGTTVEFKNAALAPLATPAEMKTLASDMATGKFGTAIFWNVDLAHSMVDWDKAIKGVKNKFHLGLLPDKTSQACDTVLPINHWLECWGDFSAGEFAQPAIAELYDTKQAEDILLAVLSKSVKLSTQNYLEFIKQNWAAKYNGPLGFDNWWNSALHDGFRAVPTSDEKTKWSFDALAINLSATRDVPKGMQLLLTPDSRIYDGRGANIGWLQEMPDAVDKTTWGNPLKVSHKDAERLGIETANLVNLTVEGVKIKVPVLVQPGQKDGVLSLTYGHGRDGLSVSQNIGVNVYPLISLQKSPLLLDGVSIEAAGGSQSIHLTQEHHLMEGRDLIRSVALSAYAAGDIGAPSHGGSHDKGLKTGQDHGLEHKEEHPATLYPEIEYKGNKWGMVIDLGACVGCAGCVIACQSENNVSVVGPEQVDKGREMQWIRLDRYYEGDLDNPDMVTQPMLCQQCDSAPCENVCPVAATTHSEDGLNQMAYNRCVGTRYCANNCPYKVRRFNFFDYTGDTPESTQLSYNPEVTVRARGVMEKCTFCVQRITDVRANAKAEGRDILDGEVIPACAASCPSNAIVFGDMNNKDSKVSAAAKIDRGYKVLEDLGIRPVITYLAEVKNTLTDGGRHEH
jgi:MoCo/4Fe-4S cofactor protein with predicted Tat translocation signal